jgi:hypothetical protein
VIDSTQNVLGPKSCEDGTLRAENAGGPGAGHLPTWRTLLLGMSYTARQGCETCGTTSRSANLVRCSADASEHGLRVLELVEYPGGDGDCAGAAEVGAVGAEGFVVGLGE